MRMFSAARFMREMSAASLRSHCAALSPTAGSRRATPSRIDRGQMILDSEEELELQSSDPLAASALPAIGSEIRDRDRTTIDSLAEENRAD